MKKLVALLMVLALALSFTACGTEPAATPQATPAADASVPYIKDKGEMVIGITEFQPMNYYDESGKLIGFDTEFAEAVCEVLGVTPKFQVIEWDKKVVELNSKTIDCIWNGMTAKEDLKENMDFSTPYVQNKQVVIVKKDNVEKYKDLASMAGASIVAETGSAGESAIQGNETLKSNPYTGLSAQKDVLMEIKAGTAELGVIDYIMAVPSIGEGTDYSDLVMLDVIEQAPEVYAIGFRKGETALVDLVNNAIQKLADEGKLQALAEKYNMADGLIVK